MSTPQRHPESVPPRRGFFEQLAALTVGAVISLVPLAAGLFTFFDPWRRKSTLGGYLRVARLDALPADGLPRRFPVVSTRIDAWNHFPPEPIGLVYLRRTAQGQVTAHNGACPHAGCIVDYKPLGEPSGYHCPCHDSHFAADGIRQGEHNPAPRDLDALEIDPERLEQGEIWVRFENFVAGKADKVVAT